MKEIYVSSYLESKEKISTKPYIVSGDIKVLLQDWCNNTGFCMPSQDFFVELRSQFSERMQQLFPCFEFVTEDELSQGLSELVAQNNLTPIALDRVYFRSTPRLDITRVVGSQENSKRLSRRSGTPPLLTQIRAIKKAGIQQIALVDDVIFTGDLTLRTAEVFKSIGIDVPKIYAGVGIGEGIKKLSLAGISVDCVKQYDEVIDEVCERDFYPGVPYSGRLVDPMGNIGAPYILPFGDPASWASIPSESQESFSRFCINQTINLFSEIERISGSLVQCCHLDRQIVSFPNDSTRFVDSLKKLM